MYSTLSQTNTLTSVLPPDLLSIGAGVRDHYSKIIGPKIRRLRYATCHIANCFRTNFKVIKSSCSFIAVIVVILIS